PPPEKEEEEVGEEEERRRGEPPQGRGEPNDGARRRRRRECQALGAGAVRAPGATPRHLLHAYHDVHAELERDPEKEEVRPKRQDAVAVPEHREPASPQPHLATAPPLPASR
ncbi:unnamed protein product, partial [Urochloa humidicola]